MSEVVKGKVIAKAGNGKGFKIEGVESWFNATDKVVPYLAKIEKGTVVEVTYETKGVAKIAVKIETQKSETPVATKQPEKKYEGVVTTPVTKTYTPIVAYGSADDVLGKQKGCALGAAASMLAGRNEDPETLAEMAIVVADKFFVYLQQH